MPGIVIVIFSICPSMSIDWTTTYRPTGPHLRDLVVSRSVINEQCDVLPISSPCRSYQCDWCHQRSGMAGVGPVLRSVQQGCGQVAGFCLSYCSVSRTLVKCFRSVLPNVNQRWHFVWTVLTVLAWMVLFSLCVGHLSTDNVLIL